jgi:hypothetical protein
MGRRGQGSKQGSGARDQGPAEDPASREVLQTLQSDPPAVQEIPSEQSDSGAIETVIKEAFSSSEEKAGGDAARPPSAAASKRVEVLFRGRLGPKLLTRGDTTDDPAYVALLGDRRGLVREVISEEEN